MGGANGGRTGFGEDHHPARHRVGWIVEGHAAQVAIYVAGGGIVDRAHLGVVARGRDLWSGIDHCLHPGVDAIARGAIRLRGNVERGYGSANQAPLSGGLDRHMRQLLGGKGAADIAAPNDLGIGDRPFARDNGAAASNALDSGDA